MKVKAIHAGVVAALGGSGVGLSQTAWAQAELTQGGGLEEIVVTATRQELSLQDVPLAVVAISGDAMTRQGIENMEDLNAVVPNVVIAGNNIGTDTAQFVMRGIPNVGVYIDGIWQVSGAGLLLREFVETERVEVLRGPQGTLYGRDSTGGAIRIYTAPPGDEFGLDVDVSLGNLERRDVKASVNIPITDNFSSRITLGSFDRDGYITSTTTGDKRGAYEDEAVRADFLWEPTDRVRLRFNAQSDTITSSTARVQTWIEPQLAYNTGIQLGLAEAYDVASEMVFGEARWNCDYACAGWPGGQLGEWETTSEITVPSRQWLEQQTVDLTVDITDSVSFQYLLGHTYVDARTYNDWDSGEFNFFIDYFNNETDLTSHEFQFSGRNDRFSWVGGAYYWDQEGRARNPSYSMRDWEDWGNFYNQAQPFNYGDVVAAAEACQMSPADRGLDFTGQFNVLLGRPITAADRTDPVAGWPFACEWPGGGPGTVGSGWVGALAAGAAPPAGDRLTGNEIDGYAVFGEVVIGLTERFDLTLGYRYHDQSEEQFTFDVDAGVAAGITAPKPVETNKEWFTGGVYDGIRNPGVQNVEFDQGTIRVAGSWAATDNIMLYAGYTEGFNSGGLDVYSDSLGQVEAAFDPEIIENSEIGLRSDLVDGRLRFNATYFLTDWIGVQLPATILDRDTGQEITELVTQNAASAEASGFEVELGFAATDNVLIQANLGWLDTKYTDSQSPAVSLNTEFSRAPEETYNLGIQHDAPLANGGTFMTRFDANYTGPYWRSSTPSLRQNAYGVPRDYEAGDYWLYNARFAYTPPDGRYEVALYGLNLSDEYHINSGFLHNIWQFDFGTVDRPREVGVTMSMFFQ